MRRVAIASALLLLSTGAALGASSDHLSPSPHVTLRGGSSVPGGGVHFSPVRDPREGRWSGSITWSVGCEGAERWSWSVQFADVASGSYGRPPDVPRERSQSAFFFAGSGFDTRPGSSSSVDIPAGSFVYPYVEGQCYGDSHWSARGHADGAPLHVPPYIWYPTIAAVKGRRLQSVGSGAVVLRKGRSYIAGLRVAESAVGKESVELRLVGAGVRVRKGYGPGRLDRPVTIRFRPTKVGVVRYWAVVEPYGVRSLVYGLRVKR